MNAHTPPLPRIIILAAGFSNRLGRPKVLAKVRGRSLLARTIAVLTPWAAGAIIVVVPPRMTSYRTHLAGRDIEFVVNAHRARGLSSSVLRGLRRARHASAVMLLPVDLAELSGRDVGRLIARWRARRRRVVARRVGGGAAAPLILPHRFIALARELRGDEGLRDFVRRLAPEAVTLLDMSSADADIDTTQDLERIRRRMRPAGGA